MAAPSRPRHGSLQFYPRKRVSKFVPEVNWGAVLLRNKDNNKSKIMGFIGYKAGMKTAFVKDLTPNSITKDKKIAVPCTIVELPPMKILSIRFYKNMHVVKEILSDNIEKEMKGRMKMPTKQKDKDGKEIKSSIKEKLEAFEKDGKFNEIQDVRIIVYSVVKKAGFKKTPDIGEVAIAGNSVAEKLAFVKEHLEKEIHASDVFKDVDIVDVRGVTRGKGFSGPVKRFGIELRQHKSEKGVRKPGSLAPWHPARITFRAPMAGQLGVFTRVVYNNKVILLDKVSNTARKINPEHGFKRYGMIKNDYMIIRGSVQGPQKRVLFLTSSFRKTKKQEKKKFEFIELR